MTSPPPQSSQWSQHEHVAAPVDAEANRLIAVAGSPELAKQAVDSAGVASEQPPPVRSLEELARRTGFAGRSELLSASTPLSAPDGSLWWATAVDGNRWIVWRLEELSLERTFASVEEIQAYLAWRFQPARPT
jgi:hypothetical protein